MTLFIITSTFFRNKVAALRDDRVLTFVSSAHVNHGWQSHHRYRQTFVNRRACPLDGPTAVAYVTGGTCRRRLAAPLDRG